MEYAQEFRINLGIAESYGGFISSFLRSLHTKQTDFKAYTKSWKNPTSYNGQCDSGKKS